MQSRDFFPEVRASCVILCVCVCVCVRADSASVIRGDWSTSHMASLGLR